MQRIAALEAPLNICETFVVLSLIFAVSCGAFWQSPMKWTRLGLILTVGMMSWTAEQVLFVSVTKNGIQAGDILLSRPYIFMITRLVVGVWAILRVCLALLFATIVIRFVIGLWLTRGENQCRGNENVNQLASMYT